MMLRRRLALELRAAWARAWVRIYAANRYPSWVIYESLVPLLGVAAYVYVYRASGAPKAYEGFAILGGAMTAYWMNMLWNMAGQFFWERENGTLGLYVSAPASRLALLTGMALGGALASTLRAATLVIAGVWIFQVPLSPERPWAAAAVFLLTLVALYAMGMTMAALFLPYGRAAQAMLGLLVEPVYAASGLHFPLRHLPSAVAMAACLVPLTLGVDALRQTVFPDGKELAFLPLEVELAGLAVLTVFFLAAAGWAMARMELKGRENGTLSLRNE